MNNFIKKTKEEIQDEINIQLSVAENNMSKVLSSEQDLKNFLKFMNKFTQYSAYNLSYIHKQFPNAQALGTFNFWKKQGYSIKKGEKAIKIFTPVTKKVELSEQEKLKNPGVQFEDRVVGFKTSSVFDITQTNMPSEEYPQYLKNQYILINEEKNSTNSLNLMKQVANNLGIKVRETNEKHDQIIGAATGGFYLLEDHTIYLNHRRNDTEKLYTIVHELAHAIMHHKNSKLRFLSKEDKELQAEMVNYLVSNFLDHDFKKQHFDYLSQWKEDKEIKDMKHLINVIKKTSHIIIEEIQKELEKKHVNELQHDNKNKITLSQVNEKFENNQELENKKEWAKIYQTDIINFLETHGGDKFNKEGRYYRSSNHDSLLITEGNIFHWNSRNLHGKNPAKLIESYFDLNSIDEAKLFILNNDRSNIKSIDRDYTSPSIDFNFKEQIKEYEILPESESFKYLTEKRALHPNIINWFQQQNILSKNINDELVFKWLDPKTNEIVGASKQTCEDQSIKYIYPNLEEHRHNGIQFNIINKPESTKFNLVACESMIDAMSYVQIHHNKLFSYSGNTRFIVMNGLKANMLFKESNMIHDGQKIEWNTITLATDNYFTDDGSRNFIDKLIYDKFPEAFNSGKLIIDTPIETKDWNEQLQLYRDRYIGIKQYGMYKEFKKQYKDFNKITQDKITSELSKLIIKKDINSNDEKVDMEKYKKAKNTLDIFKKQKKKLDKINNSIISPPKKIRQNAKGGR